MQITLNLLPPEKRKILYNVYLLYFLKILSELLLLYGVIVAVFMLWASTILENNLKDFQTKTNLIETESQSINQQLMKINETLQKVNMASNNYIDWSGKMAQFSNTKMTGINLSGVDITKDNKITIQGRAATRQSLLDYQKNLESSDLVKNLEIPVSVLTAKENIDFEIKGQFNLK